MAQLYADEQFPLPVVKILRNLGQPLMYRIVIQPTALKLLREINDRRIWQKISDRIDKLRESPELQGKPL